MLGSTRHRFYGEGLVIGRFLSSRTLTATVYIKHALSKHGMVVNVALIKVNDKHESAVHFNPMFGHTSQWRFELGGSKERRDRAVESAGHPLFVLSKWEKLLLVPTVDYEAMYREIRAVLEVHPTAGEWFLERQAYTTWKERQNGFLWLTGCPGSGKTVLSAVVMEDLKNESHAIVLSSNCDYRDPRTCDPINMYARMLYQLLLVSPSDYFTSTIIRQLEPYQNAQFKLKGELPLVHLIIRISRKLDKRLFIIVDALDDCSGLEDMLLGLSILAKELPVFVASRDHPHIRNQLGQAERISIGQDDIIEDLRKYAKKETKRMQFSDPSLRASIVDTLVSGAQGCFLWAACHVQQLRGCRSDEDMRKALTRPPPAMKEFFVKALSKITAGNRPEQLHLVLRLVLCAVQPITLHALTYATGTFQMGGAWRPSHSLADATGLIDECANLITCIPGKQRAVYDHYWSQNRFNGQGIEINISDNDDLVVPFHTSLRDFLIVNAAMLPRSLAKYALHPLTSIHDGLARLCQHHLNLAFRLQGPESNLSRRSFTNYALSAYSLHLRSSGRKTVDSQDLFLMWEQDRVDSWEPIMRYFLENFDIANINIRGPKGRTALHWAVRGRSLPLVTLVVRKGAKVDGIDDRGDTPLLLALKLATSAVSVPIIKYLLDNGADVSARDRRGCTPDYLATRRGYNSLTDLILTASARPA